MPAEPADISLAADGGQLWVATETDIGSYRDGVWGTPERPPEVSKIFAVAPASDSLWAFGLDGGVWRRRQGTWSVLPPPVIADFYDAIARSANDVTAVGFDYGLERGVIINWDGADLDPLAIPDMWHVLLYAVALSPDGEAWAGGCDYSDRPRLLRDHGNHQWDWVAVPEMTGCIYDLAFSPNGLGLAAAGSDILMLEGSHWRPALLNPPEGSQWVRVAGTSAVPVPSPDVASGQAPPQPRASGGTGWAIAGHPTWRGYTSGKAPYYFDGYQWRPAQVQLLGMDDQFLVSTENSAPRPFLDLASDGYTAYSVCRTVAEGATEGQAAILRLEGGVVTIAHPLLETASSIAALSADEVWAGGRGVWPLARYGPAWHAESVERREGRTFFAIDVLDVAARDAGWALGRESERYPVGGDAVSWRWNGVRWQRVALPPGVPMTNRLRASPDGSAWLASRSGQLWTYDGNEWRLVKAAPLVSPDVRATVGSAPFDLTTSGGRTVGCLAGADGLYRYDGGSFERVGRLPRGQVIDLQLVDGTVGWAIAVDRFAAGSATQPTGVLVRLSGCVAQEVPVQLPDRLPNIPGSVRDVDWWLMAAVDRDEVWLTGFAIGPWLYVPILAALFGPQTGTAHRPWIAPFCAAGSIAAVRADSGTDVWLVSDAPCGPNPSGAAAGYAGPIGVLCIRAVQGSLVFPSALRSVGAD